MARLTTRQLQKWLKLRLERWYSHSSTKWKQDFTALCCCSTVLKPFVKQWLNLFYRVDVNYLIFMTVFTTVFVFCMTKWFMYNMQKKCHISKEHESMCTCSFSTVRFMLFIDSMYYFIVCLCVCSFCLSVLPSLYFLTASLGMNAVMELYWIELKRCFRKTIMFASQKTKQHH